MSDHDPTILPFTQRAEGITPRGFNGFDPDADEGAKGTDGPAE